ncbi:MAG: hypothetical protein AB7L90_22840 [Hyphomicrobiaceae bacterium]
MTIPLTVEHEIHFRRHGRGSRKEIQAGHEPQRSIVPGRVPRVARLMALAVKFEDLRRARVVERYSDLAVLGHVTRARISQIMNLLNLAPDIQEQILFLPRVEQGPALIHLRQLQPIAAVPDWRKQRKLLRELLTEKISPSSSPLALHPN